MKILLPLAFILFIGITTSAQTVSEGYVDGQLYIKIREYAPMAPAVNLVANANQTGFLNKHIAEFGITEVRLPFSALKSNYLQHVYCLSFTEIAKTSTLIRYLYTVPEIEFVERVPLFTTDFIPNDYDTISYTLGTWALNQINAQAAWDITTGNPDVVLAIVDNAVDVTHEDLAANIWVNPGEIPNNGIDDDNNGYIDDVKGYDVADHDNNTNPLNAYYGHGTLSAGIAGAISNNGLGVASLGYNVKIMPVKVSSNNGWNNILPYVFDGIAYAIASGADVINASAGSLHWSTIQQQVINYARQQGITIVASAGNDNFQYYRFPAAYPQAIAVAATGNGGANDIRSGFSNFGTWIDICAPGENLKSTAPVDSYVVVSGTSGSGPLVAALAALIKSANASLTPLQIEHCIKSTAVNIDNVNPLYINKLGAGRIDAAAALQCAINTPLHPYNVAVTSVLPIHSGCTNGIAPVIVVENRGSIPITAITFSYHVGILAAQQYNWTGYIAPQSEVEITMPVTIPNTLGTITYYVTAGTLNTAFTDADVSDNTQSKTTAYWGVNGQTTTFNEGFQVFDFAERNWSVENPDSNITWGLRDSYGQGFVGSSSAYINFYNYNNTGQRDGLISPPIQIPNVTTALLQFEYSYCTRTDTLLPTDSLIVYVSTDCGVTYPYRVWARGEDHHNSFATANAIDEDFYPHNNDDWCSNTPPGCINISLSQFVGQTIRIKFEGYNSGNNNVYLDDIKVSWSGSSSPVVAYVMSTDTVCMGDTVWFYSTSSGVISNYLWHFENATPDTSVLTETYTVFNTPGTAHVSLTAYNGPNTTTLTRNITVLPAPQLQPAAYVLCKDFVGLYNFGTADYYTWQPLLGLDTIGNNIFAATPAQTTTYTITGYTGSCTDTITASITIVTAPIAPTIALQNGVLQSTTPANTYQWYVDGVEIPGATAQTYTPLQNGIYKVVVSSADSCTAESELYVEIISIAESVSGNGIKLYPNPAQGLVFVEIHTTHPAANAIKLTDALGRIISSENNNGNGKFTLPLKNAAPGIYFVTVTTGNEKYIRKLIVN